MTEAEDERPYDNWAKYRSAWWTRYFTGELAHFWPPQLDQPEPDKDDYRWVSRSDVFAIAATESEHRELHTAVAAYVWGLGKNAYSIGRLVRAFTANVDTVESNHGYKWMTDYARSGTVFTLIADALAVSLNMVECAVCLFEAAARAPGGHRPAESHVPERFEPTIAAWSVELFGA